MNEVISILDKLSLWILLPMLSFLLSQFYYPPILKLRELIGEISTALTYYANVFPLGENEEGTEINLDAIKEAQAEIRSLGARLRGARDSIPFYSVSAFFGFIPKWDDTEKAATNLIGWSSYVYEKAPEGSRGRHHFRKNIAEALGIPHY